LIKGGGRRRSSVVEVWSSGGRHSVEMRERVKEVEAWVQDFIPDRVKGELRNKRCFVIEAT
jgi:hypothetical protein